MPSHYPGIGAGYRFGTEGPDWNRAREIAARGGDLAVDC